ncbi:MAG: DUF3149 domain-containing protein [Vogesella sp.]|nr:DUF3149 domain-containing protein [Vogesella sp.]
MELWKQLLSDDVGLMSAIVIAVTTIIVSTCIAIFIKNTNDDK